MNEQRDIKFRVWNKATKSIHYPDWEELAIRAKLPEMVLMQFTGLQDKNGTDIYEGDIAACSKHYAGVKRDGNYEVKFENGAFVVDTMQLACFTEIEVLGNKFDQPDLTE